MNMARAALFLPLFFSASAFCQSLSYQDADTPGEAVGMMNTTLIMNRKLLSECTKRFPEHEEGMRDDLKKWEDAERSGIYKAQYFWAQMAKRDPKMLEFPAYAEGMVVRNIEGLASAPAPSDVAAKVLQDYCRKHFSSLAAGIWRTRTPKAYEFLDRAPVPSESK